MHERDIIRHSLSVCDEIDARLAAMPPRYDAPTRREYWEGARDTVIFAAILGGAVWLLLSAGGV
jgi:hypothetical protein